MKVLFMRSYFIRIFIYLLIIEAVRNFSIYKLTGWDSANKDLFEINIRNTGSRCDIWSKLK